MQLGLTTIFTSKADLSGISQESKGYQIEELVQHVAIRIDEAFSSESALSGIIKLKFSLKKSNTFLFLKLETCKAGKILNITRSPLVRR